MARRSLRGLAAALITVTLAACSPATTDDTAGPPSTATSVTTLPSTTTGLPTTSTNGNSAPPSTTEDVSIDATVTVPEGEGPFPALVLVHGGGWVTGGTGIMEPLAEHLGQNGFVTVNTEYALASFEQPAFPEAVEDIACAVRFAASHPASDGTVALIGHSAGAHLGAIVALTGDDYQGDCPLPGSGVPERFVGLAGPYDVTRVGLAIAVFFGGGPERLPEVWEMGNPQGLTDENVALDSLIMYGSRDGIVSESFAVNFHDALLASGSTSHLELVEGARHNDLHDPDLVGDLISTWLDR